MSAFAEAAADRPGRVVFNPRTARGQVNGGRACTTQFSRAKCARFAGSVVAQPDRMKPHNLFSVGVLILALALPGTASAQRGGGRSQGGSGRHGAGRPVGIVGHPVARPTVVVPRVRVRQPIVAGFARPRDVARPHDFGSIGFGSGVRTGFERPPFGTGFVAPNHRLAAPLATGRQAFRSRAFGRSHAFGGPIIVGYPWWAYWYGYPYQNGYPYQDDYQTPAGGYYQTPFSGQSDVYGGLECRPARQRTGLTSRINQALPAA